MDTILQMLLHRAEHLIGRFSGPLNFRLFVMPTVVTILAIRADRKDAREGRPVLLGPSSQIPPTGDDFSVPPSRMLAAIFLVAIVLDTAYQLFVLRSFYPGEVLVVAVVCAVVPYVLVRGPITRLVRRLYRRRPRRPKRQSSIRRWVRNDYIICCRKSSSVVQKPTPRELLGR